MTTYLPSIPNADDLISSSQGQIKTNFTQLNNQFGVDHTEFNNGGVNGDGFHKKVTFTAPIASPSVSSTQGIAYPKTSTIITPSSSNTEMFYKNVTGDIQITSSTLNSAQGEGFIPGGLQVKCGSGAITNTFSNTTVTFTNPFPTATLSVTVTGFSSQTFFFLSAVSGGASFVANRAGTSGTASFYWIAVGH